MRSEQRKGNAMTISLKRAEELTIDAARRNGLEITVIESKWYGKTCITSDGRRFRVAGVRVAMGTAEAWKTVSMAENGAARVA